MCGIAGWLGVPPNNESIVERVLLRMRHRGPDASGTRSWSEATLLHTRLSIIDLSPTGQQPMANEDGTVWTVFNGEIYNHLELRHALEAKGHVFRGRSDTEVIPHLYEEEGPTFVTKLRGMFAIALWDDTHQRLFLARDRLGKKPLYYYHDQGRFVFASELKALLQCPYVRPEIDPVAIEQYLTWGYIQAPRSILKDVQKLPPGHWLTFDLPTHHLRIQAYWSLEYQPKLTISLQDAAAELRRLVSEAVRLRLLSDVPVGALLSGGIDSSVVVGLMAEHSSQPVKTFSIGFEEEGFNELPYARQVAQRFGTDHHELVVRPQAAQVLPDVVWYLDEPMADISALPSYYLAQMARQHVKVVLNGDGGDETFAGYKSYAAVTAYRRYQSLPTWIRKGLLEPMLRLATYGQPSGHLISRCRRLVTQSELCLESQFLRWMTLCDQEMRRSLYTHDFTQSLEGMSSSSQACSSPQQLGPLDWMLRHDTLNYLPGDLLVKMDRMTMAHSLEARSPLLDQEVVQFAARLPPLYKRKGFVSKRILRLACEDLLPQGLTGRAKHGFSVPVDRWLRGELKSMVADILFSGPARERGIFNMKEAKRLWEEHQQSRKDHGHRLWALLVLELWQRQFLCKAASANLECCVGE